MPAACQCRISPLPLEALSLVWSKHGRKALSHADARIIAIDPDWWEQLDTTAGRAAVFCHEWAHIEGAECEDCADRRGGEHLRELGFAVRDGARTFLDQVHTRPDSALTLLEGYGYGLDDAELQARRKRQARGRPALPAAAPARATELRRPPARLAPVEVVQFSPKASPASAPQLQADIPAPPPPPTYVVDQVLAADSTPAAGDIPAPPPPPTDVVDQVLQQDQPSTPSPEPDMAVTPIPDGYFIAWHGPIPQDKGPFVDAFVTYDQAFGDFQVFAGYFDPASVGVLQTSGPHLMPAGSYGEELKAIPVRKTAPQEFAVLTTDPQLGAEVQFYTSGSVSLPAQLPPNQSQNTGSGGTPATGGGTPPAAEPASSSSSGKTLLLLALAYFLLKG